MLSLTVLGITGLKKFGMVSSKISCHSTNFYQKSLWHSCNASVRQKNVWHTSWFTQETNSDITR